MEKEEFVAARTRLDKTQKEMSQLLGVSVKALVLGCALYAALTGLLFIPALRPQAQVEPAL